MARRRNGAVDIIGIVINPKLNRPVLATWDGSDVDIYRLDDGVPYEGAGNYDPGGSEYSKPQQATGFPRVHTVSGVETKKKGYGTALYTALCLGAHLNSESIVSMGLEYDGDGISSGEGRSSAATRWWEAAKDLGLAESHEGEEEEEDVDLAYDVSESDLDPLVPGKSVSRINCLNVDLVETVEADVYPYDNAWGADLAVAELSYEAYHGEGPEVANLWKRVVAGDEANEVHDVNWQALCASDVRGLDVDAVNLLTALSRYAGADEEAVDAMRVRWEMNLDPSTPIRQMRLPFKMNAEDAALAKDAVVVAKALRRGLAWKKFASLP